MNRLDYEPRAPRQPLHWEWPVVCGLVVTTALLVAWLIGPPVTDVWVCP